MCCQWNSLYLFNKAVIIPFCFYCSFPVYCRRVLKMSGVGEVRIHLVCGFSWFELQKLPMSSQPQVPVGPLPMVPEDQAENSKWTEALLSTWMRISEVLLV